MSAIVLDMLRATAQSAKELRKRVTNVTYAPIPNQMPEAILFSFDGKPFKGLLKGRNADLVLGTADQNAAIAVRVMLDGDAEAVK